MGKRVLLTGGLGFIGGHTVEHFLRTTDWEIVVIDALRHAGNIARLTEAASFDPSRVSVHWHDLRAPIYEELAEKINWPDYIVHMASDSHVDRSISDPAPFIRNNVDVTLTMLEYARQCAERGWQVEKFIQIGTDEIFGPAEAGTSHREADPLKPSNPYSASKAAQEMIAMAYWRTYGVPVVLTRTMNNFGERQNREKFVPKVIRQVAAREVVTIHAEPLKEHADPENPEHWRAGSRVWLHARNHADALRYVLEKLEAPLYSSSLPSDAPLRLNIAGEVELNNYNLAQLIASIVGIPLRFRFVDFHSSRPGHDLRYSLDGTLLRELGWRQPMTMADSFEKAVRWTLEHEVRLTDD